MTINGGLCEMGIYMPSVIMLGLPSEDIHVANTTLVGGPICKARSRGTLTNSSSKVHAPQNSNLYRLSYLKSREGCLKKKKVGVWDCVWRF